MTIVSDFDDAFAQALAGILDTGEAFSNKFTLLERHILKRVNETCASGACRAVGTFSLYADAKTVLVEAMRRGYSDGQAGYLAVYESVNAPQNPDLTRLLRDLTLTGYSLFSMYADGYIRGIIDYGAPGLGVKPGTCPVVCPPATIQPCPERDCPAPPPCNCPAPPPCNCPAPPPCNCPVCQQKECPAVPVTHEWLWGLSGLALGVAGGWFANQKWGVSQK